MRTRSRIYSHEDESMEADFLSPRYLCAHKLNKLASMNSCLANPPSPEFTPWRPILSKASIDIVREGSRVITWPDKQYNCPIGGSYTCSLTPNSYGKAKKLGKAFCVISGVNNCANVD